MDFLIIVEDVITGEVRAEFLALRLWRYSGQPCNNRQTYGELDVTDGFSRSERSRNTLEGIMIVMEGCFMAERDGSSLSRSQCLCLPSVFLYIFRKLLSVLLAEQHSVLLPQFARFMCQEVWNRGVCGSNSHRA